MAAVYNVVWRCSHALTVSPARTASLMGAGWRGGRSEVWGSTTVVSAPLHRQRLSLHSVSGDLQTPEQFVWRPSDTSAVCLETFRHVPSLSSWGATGKDGRREVEERRDVMLRASVYHTRRRSNCSWQVTEATGCYPNANTWQFTINV